MTGHESRTYGTEITWKDGNGSVLLIPGEQARQPYPFPTDYTCPHCGRRNGNIRTETFFRCWTCGQLIERDVETMPVTVDLISQFLDGMPYEEKVCKCGKTFRKKVRATYTECGTCRCIKANEDYRARRRAMSATKSTKKEDTVRRVETGAPRGLPGNEG